MEYVYIYITTHNGFVFLNVRPNVSDMSMGFLPHLELTNQSFAKVMLTQFEQI